MTHTPGPWTADDGGVSSADQDICYCGELAQWSGDSFHSLPSAKANARLIAAAPELLEALKEAARTISLMTPQLSLSTRRNWGETLEAERQRCEAAISKATGAA